ncbi:unnamed protein product [Caretta caretta]
MKRNSQRRIFRRWSEKNRGYEITYYRDTPIAELSGGFWFHLLSGVDENLTDVLTESDRFGSRPERSQQTPDQDAKVTLVLKLTPKETLLLEQLQRILGPCSVEFSDDLPEE